MPTQSTIDITELDNILLMIGENLGEALVDGSRFTKQVKLRRLAIAQDWASDILVDDLRISLFDNTTINLIVDTQEYELSASTRAVLDYIQSIRIKYDADGDYHLAQRISENEMQRIEQDYAEEELDKDEDSVIVSSTYPVWCISEGVKADAEGDKIYSFKLKIMPSPSEAVTNGIKIIYYNMPDLIGYPQNDDEFSFNLHKKCVRLLIQYATAELKRIDNEYKEAEVWEVKAIRTAKELNDAYNGKLTNNEIQRVKPYIHF